MTKQELYWQIPGPPWKTKKIISYTIPGKGSSLKDFSVNDTRELCSVVQYVALWGWGL